MSYRSLQDFIKKLEKEGELVRIKEEVDSYLEITEITECVAKDFGPALLFEKVKDSPYPVLTNAMGTYRRMTMALGVENFEMLGERLEKFLDNHQYIGSENQTDASFSLSHLGKVISMKLPAKGHCQEVITYHPDLRKLPILHGWPKEERPSINLPIVMAIDPKTSNQTMETYQIQVLDRKRIGLHMKETQKIYELWENYKERGERMPVSVVIGGAPSLTYAAVASTPKGIDKIMLAGHLRQTPIKMIKSMTNDITVPAEAEFIIEGYVDVDESLCSAGMVGSHTGYYSEEEKYLVLHVTCMTTKKEPVYPAMILGKSSMELQCMNKATERLLLQFMKRMSPEITNIDFPLEGAVHGCIIASIKNRFLGQAKKVMNMIWGMEQTMCSKMVIVVDDDIEPNDYEAVATRILECVTPEEDILFSPGALSHLEYASPIVGYGYRLGIDATKAIKQGTQKWHDLETLKRESFSTREALNGIIREMAVITEGVFKGYTVASICKKDSQDINRVCQYYWDQENIQSKCFIIVDENVDIKNTSLLARKLFGNIDVQRDVLRIADEAGHVKVIIDATQKGPEEGYYRSWPQEMEMSQEVKKQVKSKWESYMIQGALINQVVE